MSPPDSRDEESLFAEALALPAAARPVFLEQACGGDTIRRSSIEALLRAHEAAGSFLPGATGAARPAGGSYAFIEEQPGDWIGRYKLMQKIGEGGCGIVYMAEQEEPVRRRVALKVIKLGMDTKEVVARFEAERQALAMMDHPNIAKVLDAGATDSGRPFFVMDLVRGIPVTKYCDEHNLATEQRLELFSQICHAIQHAHQKGIIHRDIKPTNILVTSHDGVPVPKVIDFGIAKATQGRLTDNTYFTAFEQFIGTPAYMSPEQAEMSGLDIDTRSDVYSLGVLLYELLAGRPPFDPKTFLAAGIDEMRRLIWEVDPPKPSTRLSTLAEADRTMVAKLRGMAPAQLSTVLLGDLDWIVMRCLEKDRTRRYETVNGLAKDVQRYLDQEPVLARPPSTIYTLRKYVRRNKITFAVGGVAILALSLGLVFSLWIAFAAASAVIVALVVGLAAATWALQRERAASTRARAAQARETELRQQTEAQERTTRRIVYASDMNLVQHAVDLCNFGRAWELLNRHRPKPGEMDLRGWEWRYLWNQCRSDALGTFCQRPNAITALVVSHDGKWLALGEYPGGVSVWEIVSRRKIVHLPHGIEPVHLAFSPIRSLLAYSHIESGGLRKIRMWNVTTREFEEDIILEGGCKGLVFSADGNTLVIAEGIPANRLCLWSLVERRKVFSHTTTFVEFVDNLTSTPPLLLAPDATYAIQVLGKPATVIQSLHLANPANNWRVEPPGDIVSALALSSNARILASASGWTAEPIRLWDAATGQSLGELGGHRAWISTLAFSPDGKTLASASADQTIRLWDAERRVPIENLCGHRSEVWSLAFLPDGGLVSGGKDGSVMLWPKAAPKYRRGRLTAKNRIQIWQFTSDSKSIVALDWDNRVLLWGAGFSEPLLPLFSADDAFGLRLSPDDRWLAIGSRGGVISIWDFAGRRIVHQLPRQTGAAMPIAFHKQGQRLLTFSDNEKLLKEWDTIAWRETRSWHVGPKIGSSFGSRAETSLHRFPLAPNGRWIAAVATDGSFVQVDLETGGSTAKHLSSDGAFGSVLTSDGTFFADGVDGCGFSADGTVLATAIRGGITKLWRTEDMREGATLRGHLLGHHSAIFSSDDTRLVTGSGERDAIKVWHVESQQELLSLEGVGTHFWLTAFSPDGNVLGALSAFGNLHLWRAPSFAEIDEIEHPNGPRSVLES